MKTHRIAPGEYRIENGGRTYEVSRVEYPEDGTYWIVVEEDGYCWEPQETLRDCKELIAG